MAYITTVADIVERFKGWKGQTVLCRGCFDVLTVYHVRHLQDASQMGDMLIVTITPDKYVAKGQGRPLFPETIRAETIAALGCVDYVAVDEHPTAIETIKALRPSVYVKGGEYRERMTDALLHEKAAVESVGGVLAFTNGDECHTSDLVTMLRGA